MVRIWANRIEDGAKSINEVPTNKREAVRALVISEGYEFDEDGYAHKVANTSNTEEEVTA